VSILFKYTSTGRKVYIIFAAQFQEAGGERREA
jgi:hypothetical protein